MVTDRGLVEILNLHRKWKNEKTKNIVLLPNRLQRQLCFSKYKISLCLAFLEFRPQKMKKKTELLKKISFSCETHCSNYILSQNMIKTYAPSVLRDNLSTSFFFINFLSYRDKETQTGIQWTSRHTLTGKQEHRQIPIKRDYL